MSTSYQTIIKPVVTEKSIQLRQVNKYVFLVNPKSTKSQVKQAFIDIFKVKPVGVNLIKQKLLTKFSWRTKNNVKTGNTKKAIITLNSKDKIDLLTLKK